MPRLSKIGHVNFRVADQDRSKRFYTEVLGLKVAEEDPQHGGVFMTLGDDFHSVDVNDGRDGRRMGGNWKTGLVHVAFQVDRYEDLREAYVHLLEQGVEIDHATNHVNQRSIYFKDPDGNGLEIYFEIPDALHIFAGGRHDEDEPLPISKRGEPIPAWLLEDWPSPEALAELTERYSVPA